jgi:hypothetical protein
MQKRVVIVLLLSFIYISAAKACESCAITRMGKKVTVEETKDGWFSEYMFEQQIWVERSAEETHTLHHAGHEAHLKTSEDIHTYTIGRRFADRWSVSVALPYVIHRSKEIHSHTNLGASVESKGLGDVKLIGEYDLFKNDQSTFSVLGGVELPTGDRKELNEFGSQFETELQPGNGSYDFLLGAAAHTMKDNWEYSFNGAYVRRNKGTGDYQLGDSFSTGVAVDRIIMLNNKWSLRPGGQINYQYMNPERNAGGTVLDSGGHVLLGGPQVAFDYGKDVSIYGFYLAPIEQNMGGVHQQLLGIWGGGAKVNW